jgi:oligopeptide/dipeptide ABC transporter ATP-binding protein
LPDPRIRAIYVSDIVLLFPIPIFQEPLVTKLLQVTGLSTHFTLPMGTLKVVDNLDISVEDRETLAIVGESGCGKSMTALSLMRLVPPPGKIVSGEILFEGRNLRTFSDIEMQQIRGNRISIIFQEPMTSLNPVFRIGDQIAEGLLLHRKLSKREAREKAVDMLNRVGIPAPASRYNDYPHQLSGGMRQRIMIAMALSCEPRLLIADEPTTALDVTIQAQILELIDKLKHEYGMGLLLITHDLGVVAERAHRTAIMYAGKIVETGPTDQVLNNPLHPYTEGLLASLPQRAKPGCPLSAIPGQVPNLLLELPGCGFCERCPDRVWKCSTEPPPLREKEPGHFVQCWKHT